MGIENDEPTSLLELSDRERRIIAAALRYLDNKANNEELVRVVEGGGSPYWALNVSADKIAKEIKTAVESKADQRSQQAEAGMLLAAEAMKTNAVVGNGADDEEDPEDGGDPTTPPDESMTE